MARTFNGTTDKLEIATALGVGLFPCSLACWVRIPSLTNGTAISFGCTTSPQGYHALGIDATGLAYLETSGLSGQADAQPGSLILPNQWYHLVGVRASATSAICYLNGVAGTTAVTNIGSFTTNPNRVTIGGLENNAAYISQRAGDIFNCGVWSRALTGTEAAALAVWGTRAESVSSGLIGAWRMERDTEGSPEVDTSSGGNNMAVTGTTITLDPWLQPDPNAGQHLGEKFAPVHQSHLLLHGRGR